MRYVIEQSLVGAIVALLVHGGALANCTEDSRRVNLDRDNVIRLKRYDCRAGDRNDAPRVSVELHRFSDVAASLIVAKRSSNLLKQTIGAPRVVQNDVLSA